MDEFTTCFDELNEEEETLLLTDLYDFLGFYFVNKKWKYEIENKIREKHKDVTPSTILEYWFSYIGKCKEIENILDKDITVIANLYEYIELNFNTLKILFNPSFEQEELKGLMPENPIFLKNNYRREEDIERLKLLMKEKRNTHTYEKISNYFKSKGYNYRRMPSNACIRAIKALEGC